MSTVEPNEDEISLFLKPFHKRADLAEERLAKLEAVLTSNTDSIGFEQNVLLDSLVELRSKLEKARNEQVKEREEAKKENEKLAAENLKLQYRITHLLSALKEADKELANAISM
ncbi:hypothetical protein O6H91_14G012400 [Diphasiastrum complanatum]|uniref:Uncharacterized protein n=1 Tax=Diphasiastrum complanatum TaxID=34168 RepID=A0ACC2BLM8_DIPCM|nr:hypothetical protein O6H91_14G012400 [Diphasiastrum complanatum]